MENVNDSVDAGWHILSIPYWMTSQKNSTLNLKYKQRDLVLNERIKKYKSIKDIKYTYFG